MNRHLSRLMVRLSWWIRTRRRHRGQLLTPVDWEELTLHVLRQRGPLPLNVLVESIADEAMFRDALGGSRDLDVGLWGRSLYRQEAVKAVRQMMGRSLVLEGEGPWLLAYPAA